jgi:hypothetical protein
MVGDMITTRTYAVKEAAIATHLGAAALTYREAVALALADETWHWRRAYQPLDNRARLKAWKQRKEPQ